MIGHNRTVDPPMKVSVIVLAFFLAVSLPAFAQMDDRDAEPEQLFPEFRIEKMQAGIDESSATEDGRADGYLPFVYNGYLYVFSLRAKTSAWRMFIGGDLLNPFAVSGGTLFVYDIFNRLYSIDMVKAAVNWKSDLGDEIRGRPCVYDRYVIVSTQKGSLAILSARSGQTLFEYNGSSGIAGGPALYGNLAIVPYKNGRIVAFDVENRSVAWTFNAGGVVSVSPVVKDGYLYFGAWDETFYTLDALTGKLLWVSYVGEDVTRDFIVFGETVVLFFAKGEILSLQRDFGEIEWVKYYENVEFNFNYFQGSDKFYIFTPDFISLDAGSGETVFHYRERAYAIYKEMLFENLIEGEAVLTDEDRNRLLANTYFTVSSYPLMPPVAGERDLVYFVTEESYFYIYDLVNDFFLVKYKIS